MFLPQWSLGIYTLYLILFAFGYKIAFVVGSDRRRTNAPIFPFVTENRPTPTAAAATTITVTTVSYTHLTLPTMYCV